jgi:cytochrome c
MCVRTIAMLVVTMAVVVVAVGFSRNEARSSAATGGPDPNRFTPVVLVPHGELDEPMVFEVRPNGKVYIIERKGAFKVFDPATKRVRLIATIPVNTKYTRATGEVIEAEEGLIGLTFDPNFDQNQWVYLMYAHATISKHLVSRWELRDDQLVAGSEKVLIEYATQREICCHTGGGMAWDAMGNLYIAVGNNTANGLTGQTDERAGRGSWDDQRSSANTNDLRGKILRIHPEPDGTYTIPRGNLFPPGTPDTRPEIYAMGLRNPWRVSIDSLTGFAYWGEPGPDQWAETDNGPMGYDEFNQAKGPGNFGWPYFIGENRAIPYFDFLENRPRDTRNPNGPTNTSVNNTGLQELPPAQPPLIEYPYTVSVEFPELGSGARSAVGGPIYRAEDFRNAVRPFPSYYEGKWFIADFVRNWIFTVAMDGNGNLQSIERFLPTYKPVEIIDLKFGPDGDLYLLEYGSTWFAESPDSQLVRIEYNGSNRAPVVQLTSDRPGSALPARIAFSSAGTRDPDGDALTYDWNVASADGGPPQRFTEPNPTVLFSRPGVYTATLTVSDTAGATSSGSLRVIAGNEPPSVGITISGNKSFLFPDTPVGYTVSVVDGEDGPVTGAAGRDRLAIGIDYVSEDFDIASIRSVDQSVDGTTRFAVARSLMAGSTCAACHQLDRRFVGPSFIEIADRYRGDAAAPSRLATKVREGGSGVWGQATMPAHSSLSVRDALTIVRYMLSTGEPLEAALPLSSTHTHTLSPDDDGRGALVIRAVYSDNGAQGVPAHTSDAVAVLRGPLISAGRADILDGVTTTVENRTAGPVAIIAGANSHIAFRGIDLTGVRRAELVASATLGQGNVGIEIRLGAPTGPLLARADVPVTPPRSGDDPPTPPAPVTVTLRETQGVHDVYFVFKNNYRATPTQSLMTLVHDAYFVFKYHRAMPRESLMTLSAIRWLNK